MGKPTPDELLERHNCKTFELDDGTKFILVGGTHSAFGGLRDGLKHYSRVREFFDGLAYDVICMEAVTGPAPDYRFELEFFGKVIERIKRDRELWGELNRLLAQLYIDHPKFAKMLSGEEVPGERDLDYFLDVLKKLGNRFELSEPARKKLAVIAGECIEAYPASLVHEQLWRQIGSCKDLDAKFHEDMFLAKAVKYRKDFVICDCNNVVYPLVFVFLQPVLLAAILPANGLDVAVVLLFLANNIAVSSKLFLSPKYRKAFERLFTSSSVLTDAVNTKLIYRYREALTALQLLNLAEAFKKKNHRPGTFIYWSHALHTEGVLSNLDVGQDGIKRKLDRLPFSLLRPLYREYIFFETAGLPEQKRNDFLRAAKKAGIPVDEL